MKKEFFFDTNHANNYLTNSIVRHATGEPLIVNEVIDERKSREGEKNFQAYMTYLGTNIRGKIPVDQLNLDPIPLGMCSWFEDRDRKFVDAAMIYRTPARQWKVGLTTNNMRFHTVRWSNGDSIWLRLNKKQILNSYPFLDMITGDYPTLEEAVSRIKRTKYRSVAFSRKFAICSGNLLHYKNEGVAVGEIIKSEPELYDKFLFLKEQLKEAING